MASTNKTTNYNLSQFIGSDKPAWLSDYNQDMTKIDTAIKNAADTATSASGSASAATTAIGDLTNLTTTDKTSVVAAINEVDSEASTAQGTATAANQKALANEQAIAKIAETFNLSTNLEYTSANATATNATIGGGNMYVARNNEGSVFKVYGNLLVSPLSGTVTVTLPNTGVASASPYTIQGCGFACLVSTKDIKPVSIDVDNTGALKLKYAAGSADGNTVLRLVACLYFNTDFGDITPSE